MKKTALLVGILFAIAWSVAAFSDTGEKHHEKAADDEKAHHHEMEGHGEDHHDEMKVLHSSMAELNVQADKVFHAIIHSRFSDLGGSVEAIKKIAEGLEGSQPHKNLENLKKYNSLVKTLKIESLSFENAIENRDTLRIPEKFGSVIGVCVECHVNFRD